ncbi:MAG: hypothetical protein HQL27_02895 [Candidatus Omnitrophica bacterium]|nr:hypothetical protein [Candidatus Omnitrophota bacterium]
MTVKTKELILLVGVTEILLGTVTLFGTFLSIVLGFNGKPLNVLLFVVISAGISTVLGIGIIAKSKIAYKLLLYFSTVIIGSKILIYAGIIHLNGAIYTGLPSGLMNLCSIVYHAFVIYLLLSPKGKALFYK